MMVPITRAGPVTRSLITAILVGLCTGIADATLVQFNVQGVRGGASLTVPEWCWIVLAWSAICLASQVILLLRPWRRFAGAAAVLAGPGLLLISRLGPSIRHFGAIPVAAATLISLALAVTLASAFHVVEGRAFAALSIVALSLLGLSAVGLARSGSTGFGGAQRETRGAPARPNIVLVILDTLRYDDSQRMPNLARLASQSIVFDNAWATAPSTMPSHLAMFTGKYPWTVTFDQRKEQFQYTGRTLAEGLAARGYRTAAIFANPLLSPGTVFSRGFQDFKSSDYGACRSGLGFLLLRGYTALGQQSPVCVGVWMRASEVTERAMRYIRYTKGPFFLALNYLDPHDPYVVEDRCNGGQFVRYTAADAAKLIDADLYGTILPADAIARFHGQYRAAIACMDGSLASLFEAVRNGPSDTVLVVVADHGEHFGGHGLMGHGRSLYSPVLHVPLLLAMRERVPQRVHEAVSTVELYATLLQIADGNPTPALLGRIRQPVTANCVFSTVDQNTKTLFSIVDGSLHLIRSADGHEELFDYVNDPSELHPMTLQDDGVIANLRKSLPKSSRPNAEIPIGMRGLGYLQ